MPRTAAYLAPSPVGLPASEPVTVAGVRVAPGTRRDLSPAASESYTGDRTTLPLAVVNGAHAGPRVFVTAAIHGDELNGIAIARQVLDRVHAETMRGTLVVVPIVNVLGVQNGSRYLPDRRDLNRSFPGSAEGSMAARIAHLLHDEVVAGSDVGIDLHTATNHRSNVPQVRVAESDPAAQRLAQVFGAPFVFTAPLRDGSLRATATALGIPVLTYEGGQALRFDDDAIAVGTRGVLRVLDQLGMVTDGLDPDDPGGEVRVLTRSTWLRAQRGGILELHVTPGEHVESGQPLWTTVSPLGEERARVDAPEDGWVIGATTLPLVHPGQALVHLASSCPSPCPGPCVPHDLDS